MNSQWVQASLQSKPSGVPHIALGGKMSRDKLSGSHARILRRVLNEKEVLQRWNAEVATLQKWRQQSYGPAFLKLSSRVAYPIEAVEAHERESLRKSASEKA